MPAWVDQGCTEYLKRFPRDFKVALQGVPSAARGRARVERKTVRQEGEALLQRLAPGERVVSLDLRGRCWSTEELAARVADWRMDGRNVSLLVGGPDGLDPACIERSDEQWSLSRLTLPHPLVRILLLEQLYRAWSILNGHPYHR